jgi:hypothetical protein
MFTDTGRGDDCLEKYAALLADVPLNHPVGATFSYCNAGFSLAGRVIEKVCGKLWDQVMRERIFAPLGLEHTVTLPEEALLHRTAVGHPGEPPTPARRWDLPRFAGPAGAITATARDALTLVRMHLAGGAAPDGSRVLSAASVAAMQQQEVELPDPYTLGDSWGLGWIRFEWDGRRMIGHDGNSLGQSSFLRVLPEQGFAVTLLTNGGHTRDLYEDLFREVFAELAGVAMPRPLQPASDGAPADGVADWLGTYERVGMRTEVRRRDGRLVMRCVDTTPGAGEDEDAEQEFDLLPVRDGLYVIRAPEVRTWAPVVFYRLADGSRRMHHHVRSNAWRHA